MSASPDDSAKAMEAMLQAGQTLMNSWLSFVAQQQASQQNNSVQSVPLSAEMGQISKLQQEFMQKHAALWTGLMRKDGNGTTEPVARPEPGDRRFAAPEWAQSPLYDYLRQGYLINSEFLRNVVESMPVADGKAKDRLRFLTRQYIDAMAPSNFAATNPEFVKAALETKGESISAGIRNLLVDLEKGRISMTDDSAFEVGRNLGVTPGAVIYENDLIQLIQYTPTSEQVYERPLLIVPPCINKFYIMDLQPENSFVRHAVDSGFTVFLISWRNVRADQGSLTWDDYLEKGPLTALQVVREVSGVEKPNVLGFCVGGTLLSSALAVLKGRGEDPVESLTLMTTLLDFSDAGELGCLVDEASVATREATIGKGGLLPGKELASVFSSLRANDLIWQYVVGNYLKGGTPQAFDLLYWNSDSTNLPGPFLAWYLRNMYLENNLRIPGRLEMLGVKVDLGKVDVPTYLLATREDHIVPWESAYLVRDLLGGKSEFVLGASGHIAGAINPASKNRRSYWTNPATARTAEEWLASATENKGSWWTHWINWLKEFGGAQKAAPANPGNAKYKPIEAAPGRYVKEKA